MLKILHTGDLHLGREYQKLAQIDPYAAKRCQEARIEALEKVVCLADEEKCDFLVIAGDLYDSKSISAELQKEVCNLLSNCACPVLVLPGNHDYYEGEGDKLWRRFQEYAGENTILLAESRQVEMENVVFYPCPCLDRYSESNALDWVKEQTTRDPGKIHIGLAHGAIEGLSFDREKRYYYMTQEELEKGKMDLWLIGHTHVPWPEQEIIRDQHIFNAGTHQQTDVADHSEGTVFLIEVAEDKRITARRVHTGVISFVQRGIKLQHRESLASALKTAGESLDQPNTFLRLSVSGLVTAEDYQNRYSFYETAGENFLRLEVLDGELRREITEEMIDRETMEGTLENRLLKRLSQEPELLNLAWDLIQQCEEG